MQLSQLSDQTEPMLPVDEYGVATLAGYRAFVLRVLSFVSVWVIMLNACAADDGIAVTLRGTSNYVYRSYTRSDGHPSAQLNIDYGHSSGWYGGAWMSYVDFWEMDKRYAEYEQRASVPLVNSAGTDRASLEFQPYVGRNWSLSDTLHINAQVSGYIYDGKILDRSYDYGEFSALLDYADRFSFRLGLAPDSYGYGKTNFSADVHWHYALTDIVDISAGVGGESVTAMPHYAQIYWNLGIQWAVSRHVSFDLRYYGRHSIVTSAGEIPGIDSPKAPLGFPLVASIAIAF